MPDILAGCDALAHPARYDAYGMAVQEAVCRGLPVVVSSAAGVSELYPPELSDLVLPDPEDAGELADRLWAWRRGPGNLAGPGRRAGGDPAGVYLGRHGGRLRPGGDRGRTLGDPDQPEGFSLMLISVGGRKSVERRGDIVARVSAPFKCPKETVLPF